ncbi:hypothetical protein FIBSPDRAFT_854228, partial [Athelia psychrophila]
MHAPGKDICVSALPYRRAPPTWLEPPSMMSLSTSSSSPARAIPSSIGVTLRDSHGIPQVRFIA